MVCTFFGHRDTPQEIVGTLRTVLAYLIEEKEAVEFYVGNQGGFDSMVCRVLTELQERYPHIRYTVVLAYMPQKEEDVPQGVQPIYPSEIAQYPRRFAIEARNKWMIEQAEYVVTYTLRVGGAAKMEVFARRRGKMVINLAREDALQ